MRPQKTSAAASLVLLVLLLAGQALRPLPASAAEWSKRDSPTNETLFGIDAYGDALYAVGGNGTAVYSDDAGDSWHEGDANTSLDLYDVSAISASKAVAVGEKGTVLRTTDGGDSWDDAAVDFDSAASEEANLRAVLMASSTVGYATGDDGLILKTTDGGASWEEISSPTSRGLNNIAATSASKLWIAGEGGVIYASANGGSSWTKQTSGTTEDLITVTFVDSSDGFAAGEGRTFLRTTNGGSTWKEIDTSDALDSDETISDIAFWSAEDGILATTDGTLLQTDDAGASWDEVDAYGTPILLDLLAIASDEWWGVSDEGDVYAYDDSAPGKPTDFDVTGSNGNVTDSTPTFTWTASEENGSDIDYYEFRMDSGSYKNIGNVTSRTYTTALSDGSHTAYLYAVDEAGNKSGVASVSFTVNADGTSDDSGDVSKMTPSTALKDVSVTFSARLSDWESIDSCDLYVDGASKKSMYVKTDVAYATYKFASSGTYEMYARCTDDNGDKVSGTAVDVVVSSGSSSIAPGDLIKMACTGDVYVNDPCTAVYYYGNDGKRHAFPNEATFKTWFKDFDDLVIVTSSAMADISLGRNVTYRPGSSLVKFSTSAVYAVSYNGILRPIANAEIAKAIFGSDWVSQIDIVSDVFYSNYRIGSTIESSNDYSASEVKSTTSSIDATF